MKRDTFTLPLAFPGELIVDNFAGGGGTSTGLEAAFGRPVDIAINHDPEALAMHALNHPFTHHLCESVWDVNPVEATGNQPIGLVWLSPDCKHFSKAKGSTPVEKSIRGLAWVGMRWLALTKPRVMMLENVEEFQDWGPLLIDSDGNAKPDPKKRGKTFESFVRQIRAQGYVVDWKEMRACDNGAPTIRKRLFLQARRDGIPIEWPDQSHGNPVSAEVIAGKLLPWRTAAECIDFSHPAASIFDRKRPLVHNTQRRVAKGLWKHVLTSGKPFIVGVGGRMGQSPERSVDQPVQTITSKADSCIAQPVLTPFLVGQGGPSYSGKPVSIDAPVGTIPTTNHRAVAQPVLAPFINEHANASNQRTMAADEPLRTVCAQVKGGHFSVVSPTLAPMVITNTTGHSGGPVDSPLATITTGGQQALVAAAITPLRGTSEAHLGGHDIEAPLSTVSAGGTHHALIAGHITKFNTGAIGSGLDEPLATITAGGTPKRPSTGITQGLVGAHLVTIGYGERAARYQCQCGEIFTDKHATGTDTLAPAECPRCGECNSTLLSAAQDARTQEVTEPLGTIVAGGIKSAIVAAHLVDMGHGESTAAGAKRWSHGHRDIETPLNTITASGGTAAVAAVHLTHLTHHGDRPGQTPDAPLPTITAAHRGEQVLVAACLEQANGGFYEGDGRAADAPMSTITAAGSNQRLVMAYYVKYYSSGGQDGALSTPMHTLPTKGRMGLVECQQVPVDCLAPEHRARAKKCADLLREHLPEQFPEAAEMVLVWHDAQYWVLVDITLRMLKPPELFQAQSFPKGYIIHEIPDPKLLFVNGKQVPGDPRLIPRIPLTATAQVRMCGNSVAPAQAEALARTSFKHEAQIYGRAA